MTTSSLSTVSILTAGKATFTLVGTGRQDGVERRWTYRIKKVENEGRDAVFFVSLLAGPDNESSYQYMGMYDPYSGGVRLTKASKFNDTTECVRALRWALKLIANDTEAAIEAAGFRLLWSEKCQRCGRTLTVPSSIDNRLGPECINMI